MVTTFGANEITWYLFVVFLLSISGSCFIIVSYFKFKSLHTPLYKCLFFISLSDLIYTTVFFVCYFFPLSATPTNPPSSLFFSTLSSLSFPSSSSAAASSSYSFPLPTFSSISPSSSSSFSVLNSTSSSNSTGGGLTLSPVCWIEATFLLQFIGSSWLWPACFSYQLYLQVKDRELNNLRYFHLISWGIPFFCNILSISKHAFSPPPTGIGWCWLRKDLPIGAFVGLYGALILIILFELICYILITRTIRNQLHTFLQVPQIRTLSIHFEREMSRLRWYLMVPLFCWSWGLTARIFELVTGSSLLFLTQLQACFAASQGFWNALVFLSIYKTRKLWASSLGCGDDKEVSRPLQLSRSSLELEYGIVT